VDERKSFGVRQRWQRQWSRRPSPGAASRDASMPEGFAPHPILAPNKFGATGRFAPWTVPPSGGIVSQSRLQAHVPLHLVVSVARRP